jgi:hypothetical protein
LPSRLEHGQRRRGDVLGDELGQVGRLLIGVAPQADRGGDSSGGQAGHGDAHVALGQGLAHQGGGDGGALLDGSAELLGHADHREAELVGLGQELRRGGAGGVGLLSDLAQAIEAELAHRVLEHLLLLVGLEIEQVGPRLLGLTRGARELLRRGERAAGAGCGARGAFRGAGDEALGGLA